MTGPTVDGLLGDIEGVLRPRLVFGKPVERDGVTVVPVASVRGGGGGGGDSLGNGGRGFSVQARPVGAYVIRDGSVTWEPAVDLGRLALAGLLAVVTVAFLWRPRR